MGLRDLLDRWMTPPAVGPGGYRCSDCGVDVEADAEACPECGGGLEPAVPEHLDLYWPHH